MNSQELEHLLGCVAKSARVSYAVIAANELEKLKFQSYPYYVILNTGPRWEGRHWIALIFRIKRHQIIVQAFDPLGFKIEDYKLPFKFAINSQNTQRIQGDFSEKCGEFATWFLVSAMRGMGTKSFFAQFSSNYKENDKKAEKFINRLKRCCRKYHESSLKQFSCLPYIKWQRE